MDKKPDFTEKELKLLYALVHISIAEVDIHPTAKAAQQQETYIVALSARKKFRVWAGVVEEVVVNPEEDEVSTVPHNM